MQSLFASIFAVFYLFLAIGIKVDLHYCLDKIKDVHFAYFSNEEEDCHIEKNKCCEENEHKNGEREASCCSHQQFFLQVDDRQENLKPQLLNAIQPAEAGELILPQTDRPVQSRQYNFTPPSIPIFLRHCQFTFYG